MMGHIVRLHAIEGIRAYRVWLTCGHSLLTRRLAGEYRCPTCAVTR
jgi:hypothetical protein